MNFLASRPLASAVAVLLLAAPHWGTAAPLPPGQIDLVSSDQAGLAVGGLPAGGAMCALSADGRTVAYSTQAAGLDPKDTNNKLDAYVKNLDTGRVRRVSGGAASPGPLSPGARCHAMTPDARYVVLANNDAVWVRDLTTRRLLRVSPPADSLPEVTGFFGGALSDDGRRAIFRTIPRQTWDPVRQTFVNLVPARLMFFDRSVGRAVTLPTDDGEVAHGEVAFPGGGWAQISPDGRRVIFQTSHDALVAGDSNGQWDVVVHDLDTGATMIVSRDSQNAQTYPTYSGFAYYGYPRWGAGNSVVFDSMTPSNLGPPGLYRKDLDTGVLTSLLTTDEGYAGTLSPDGRRLAFAQTVAGRVQRVVERDLRTGVETLVSSASDGTPGDGTATLPMYSRQGLAIGLQSTASQLVPGGTPPDVLQLYVKRLARPPMPD